MSAVGIVLILAVWFVLPLTVGLLFDSIDTNAVFRWISGQMLLWAGFFAICVAFILKDPANGFPEVTFLYAVYAAVLFAAGLAKGFVERKKKSVLSEKKSREKCGTAVKVLWAGVGILLVVQLAAAALLAYEEGDDAFYVAVSTITETSDSMYWTIPYTGSHTLMDLRHGLAPFPIWIAALARWSGLRSVFLAQSLLPGCLILMAYGVYYLFARKLFHNDLKKMGVFLLFTELLILFGGQSLYTAENFLLVRTTQGKAVLAGSVLSFLMYLLFALLEKLKNGEKERVPFWIVLGCVMLTGCLCSTLGALLCCIMAGCCGICIVGVYRNWKVLLPMLSCCVFPLAMTLLYFLLG